MLVQYYVLKALATEFDRALRYSTLTELYSQQKNELVIAVRKHSSENDTDEEISLCVSVSPGFNYILMRRSAVRAKKNSVSLFENLNGSAVEQVGIHPADRTMTIAVSGGVRIIIRLYNTAESNIFLVDGADNIIGSFKRSRDLSGTRFTYPDRKFDEKIFYDETALAQTISGHADQEISRALKEILPQFGPAYIKELIQRAKSRERGPESSAEKAISDELKTMSRELQAPVPVVYVGENGSAQLSVIRLRTMEHLESKEFRTVNEAVEQIISGRFRARKVETEKHTLIKRLGMEMGKIEKALTAIRNQKPADSGALEYCGQLILSNLDRIKKGMKSVELPDLHNPDGIVVIELNPSLSPAQNADKYFQKARKSVIENKETEIRRGQLEKKMETLKELESSLPGSDTSAGIKDIVGGHKDALRMLNLDQKGKEKSQLPFRVFPLKQGCEVWVGKSSASNDLLTMKHAAPHDLWFHVRGASGSHTVLKVRKGENVPREIVHQAAGIAAYYSKMRNASNVPVAYCERKYVKKPKGVKSGTVTMEREKVIFVKPQLPIIGAE